MNQAEKQLFRFRLATSLTLMIGSFIILLLSTRSLTGVPERVGLSVVSFFQKGFSTVSSFIGDSVASISQLRRLEEEYQRLLADTEVLRRMERDYDQLLLENRSLKEQLGYSTELSYESISAKIIGKDPGNIYSSFVLNKGSAAGVRKNDVVVAFQDGSEGLVGKVVEVSRNACLVLPIFDASAYIAVRLQESRYEGLAVGTGNDSQSIMVQYVKKRALPEIRTGALVITSGLQSLYPPDIVIGRIVEIHEPDFLNSLELSVQPVIDFDKLEYVTILTNIKDPGRSLRDE